MKFNELDAVQQAKALDEHRYINVEDEEWSSEHREDFKHKMLDYGFSEINLMVDTSCTQGSGASFDTNSVDMEKFLRKTKRWSKYRALHEMIKFNDIYCTIDRSIYPHYVHSNMVCANINCNYVELTTVQEEYIKELEEEITDFVRSESDDIHSNLESFMLDLINDENVKETIIDNEMEFEIADRQVTYL